MYDQGIPLPEFSMAVCGFSVAENDSLLMQAGQDSVHVEFCMGERKWAESISRRLFGRVLSHRHWAALCGAPNGSDVEVGVYRAGLYLDFSDSLFHCYRGVVRIVMRHGRPALLIEAFHVHQTLSRGKGLGLSIFTRLLAAAESLGITRIETRAGRRTDENGYYTWPRYGFSGRLPTALRRRLPTALDGAVNVLDLMESVHGRVWWQLFGVPVDVVFEVRKNSRSRKAFARYRVEKLKCDIG